MSEEGGREEREEKEAEREEERESEERKRESEEREAAKDYWIKCSGRQTEPR